jgi:hypothetical protein
MRGRFAFLEETIMASDPAADQAASGDRDFLDRFERAAFSPSEYGHREHLRTAWLYLQRLGLAETAAAIAELSRGIRRLSAAHGASQRYHETLTQVWVRLVAAACAQAPGLGFDALLSGHPELLDRDLPYRHYSRERLMSDEARARWVEPDREPLPEPPAGCRNAAGASRA